MLDDDYGSSQLKSVWPVVPNLLPFLTHILHQLLCVTSFKVVQINKSVM